MSYLRHRELTDLWPASWSDWRAYEATGQARGGARVLPRPRYPGLGGDDVGRFARYGIIAGAVALALWMALAPLPAEGGTR